jgi:hypothetical protein
MTHSPTPLPTVPANQRDQVISQLLKDNGPCPTQKLCIWGFTPDISDSDQMWNYFLSLGENTGYGFDLKYK